MAKSIEQSVGHNGSSRHYWQRPTVTIAVVLLLSRVATVSTMGYSFFIGEIAYGGPFRKSIQ